MPPNSGVIFNAAIVLTTISWNIASVVTLNLMHAAFMGLFLLSIVSDVLKSRLSVGHCI